MPHSYARYKKYDQLVMDLLAMGPMTAYRLSKHFNVERRIIEIVLARLKGHGKIIWRKPTEPARKKEKLATKDTSPFPKPALVTKSIGFFG